MSANPQVLGLAASHNGAACLLRGTELVMAVQEERLTRVKRAPLVLEGPIHSAALVLERAGLAAAGLDLVALCPLRDAAGAVARLARHPELGARPRLVVPHHLAHAAAALAQSGATDATVLVVDGAGSELRDLPADERALLPPDLPELARETVSIYRYRARDGRLTPVAKQAAAPADTSAAFADGDLRPRMMPFTSLGTMYQAVAQQIFGHWDAAGKVMGLAPLGEPVLAVEDFLTVGPDAALRFGDRVHARFRSAERWPAREREYADLAASVQRALEHALEALVAQAWAVAPSPILVYAGGVALNSVANTRLASRGPFARLFVMPAAEDNGTALGAAVLGLAALGVGGAGGEGLYGAPGLVLHHDALGPSHDRSTVRHALDTLDDASRARFEQLEPDDVCATVAQLLAQGRIVGWLQGRSEFGPRALGQRSILVDPRRADAKAVLNARVKHREAFRPFAPAVLEQHVAAWFELPERVEPRSPFMLQVWPVRPERRGEVPAVVHVDGSARVQTVGPAAGRFHALLEAFERASGVPMLLDTSFNVAGEPIVETPRDALRCFLSTGLDVCVLEDTVLVKR